MQIAATEELVPPLLADNNNRASTPADKNPSQFTHVNEHGPLRSTERKRKSAVCRSPRVNLPWVRSTSLDLLNWTTAEADKQLVNRAD